MALMKVILISFAMISLLLSIPKSITARPFLMQEVISDDITCPQLFLNCSATDLPGSTLRWFFDENVAVSYDYSHDHQYPFNVEPNHMWSDLVVQILNASLSEDNQDYANFESTLIANISTLRVHGVQNVTCGSFGGRSNIISPDLNETTFLPSPSISCSLLSSHGGPEVILQWSPSFTSQHAVERYHVAVNPDPSSCSSDQVSPSEDYSCSGLSLRTNYSMTVSAIRCGDQEGNRDTFTLLPQVPDRLFNVTTLPTYYYDEKMKLRELTVQWGDKSQVTSSQITSERCFLESTLNYSVTLESSIGERVDHMVISSGDCTDNTCTVVLSSFNGQILNQHYSISIRVLNIFGQSEALTEVFSVPQFSYSYFSDNTTCISLVYCSTCASESGQCSVQYGTDPSYQDLNSPIIVPLNSPFKLPPMRKATIYYHQVTVTINDAMFILRSVYTTEDCTFEAKPLLNKLWYQIVISCGGLILISYSLILTFKYWRLKRSASKQSKEVTRHVSFGTIECSKSQHQEETSLDHEVRISAPVVSCDDTDVTSKTSEELKEQDYDEEVFRSDSRVYDIIPHWQQMKHSVVTKKNPAYAITTL